MQPPPPFPVALLAETEEAAQVLRHTEETLNGFGVPFVAPELSGRPRRREDLARVISELEAAGAQVFVVGDASTDPLSAAVAGLTLKPVLAVPVATTDLSPLEVLQSTTAGGGGGGPVASLAIGKPGAINAAILAVAILAHADVDLRGRLDAFRADQTAKVLKDRPSEVN